MAERPKTVWFDDPAAAARRAVAASKRRRRRERVQWWRDHVGYWAGVCTFVVGMTIFIGWTVVPHVDVEGTRAALADEGYREAVVTGRRWRGCSHYYNFYRTGFRAIGPTGTLVEGVGCAGPFGQRVRIKVRSWRPPAPIPPPEGPAVWASDVLAVTSLRERPGHDGWRVLEGTVVNRTDEALGLVFVTVERRDAAGLVLDTVCATTGSLGGKGVQSLWAGHTWQMRQTVPAVGATALRVLDAGDL